MKIHFDVSLLDFALYFFSAASISLWVLGLRLVTRNETHSRRIRRCVQHYRPQQNTGEETEHFLVRLSHEGNWEVDADCVLRRFDDEDSRLEEDNELI